MTRDERQLIRMMNRSFKDKKQSRNLEIKDLTGREKLYIFTSKNKRLENEETNDIKKDELNVPYFVFDSNVGINDELDLAKKEFNDNLNDNLTDLTTKANVKIINGNDMLNLEEYDDEKEKVCYKPLIQHFVLEDAWLPYEKDLRLNKFVIHQNNSVDLEFDVIFHKPPHLRNEPSDLNDPLNVLRRFYSLMGKSDADGNNIKCSISYTDAPDEALQKEFTLYSISGTITSMEILQNYGLDLRIKVKGKIII